MKKCRQKDFKMLRAWKSMKLSICWIIKHYPAQSRRISSDFSRLGLRPHRLIHLSMSSRWGRGGGRRGIGRDFDQSLWPGGRAFEFSCCSRGRDIWIFARAHDHKSFLGVGNLVIFDLTFLPGIEGIWQQSFGKCQNPALCPTIISSMLNRDGNWILPRLQQT